MSAGSERDAAGARDRQALAAIRTLRDRLDQALAARSEPIAVIGIGCRFPGGVTDTESYWDLLSGGVDAVRPIPPERMELAPLYDPDPDTPGKTYSRWAGVVDEADAFDADFFGLSPREAAQTDPQQRVFLETAWHALEHAGISPRSLAGSDTGVFAGVTTCEYARLQDEAVAPEDISAYSVQGLALNAIAGRLCHVLGLHGPAMAIDTACSSSLVAIDRACRSLRDEECGLAIAGGVNVLSSPLGLIAASRSRMFSPDGKCRSFALGADGFVRGEGCGVVVLRRLRDAVAAGERVLAVIRGSAVNHDGASSGLTVPNGLAQQALLRGALRQAGVGGSAIGYVEAHGTGTALGDPIEAEALGAVLGAGREPGQELLIGSVKTNIGHLEAAAGVAGLIKVVLALGRGVLPGQLHWDAPSPHIRWDALRLRVVDRATAWAPVGGRRLAGVSAFGFSGTNAHLVVEEAPAVAPAAGAARPVEVLALSARSPAALRVMAERWRARLGAAGETESGDWAALCHTAGVGRAAFAHRLSVRGADAAAGLAGLGAYLAGTGHPGLVTGEARAGRAPRIGFLFSGQGSQYAGMGRALYSHAPVFREVVDRAEAVLEGLPAGERLGAKLGAVMRGEHPEAARLLGRTEWTQPALYVLEYGLAALWRSFGVEPAAALGHSLGEYVACAVAGVFGWEDGLRLVAARARLMAALGDPDGAGDGAADAGAMVAVAASEAEVGPLLAGWEASVSLAAVNGARQVTVSGSREGVASVAAACAARGWRTQPLAVSGAFHSPLMEPAGAALEARAGALAYAAPRLPVVSNVSGGVLAAASGGYWRRHMRQPVRFADGLATLAGLGCDVLLEIGPRPMLIQLARQAGVLPGPGGYVASLGGPETAEWEALCRAVQAVHAAGASLDWAGWYRGAGLRRVDAPGYPFERRRHWITASAPRAAPGSASGRVVASGEHPLLGGRLRSAVAGGQFEAGLTASGAGAASGAASGAAAWLADHRIGGEAILPATGYVEVMLAAGAAAAPGLPVLEDLTLLAPLRLPAAGVRTVQTVVDAPAEGSARVRVFAAAADAHGADAAPGADGQAGFRLHAEARLVAAPPDAGEPVCDLAALRARCPVVTEGDAHYRRLAAAGAAFGPAFRGVQRLGGGGGEAWAEIAVPLGGYAAGRPHPAALDACLQSAAGLFGDTDGTLLPRGLGRFRSTGAPWPADLVAHARLAGADPVAPEVDITVYDRSGRALARLDRLRFRAADRPAP
ncbi:MAG: acyltransferase domain-containing protein, partial [Acetobacteraceae bacterium]|nr:acyltransferase domain-containing protein [Acetobacteraceae bacterium]